MSNTQTETWTPVSSEAELAFDTFVSLKREGALIHFMYALLSDERVITDMRREATSKGWRLGDVVSPLKRTTQGGKLFKVEAMFYAYGGPS